MGIFTYESIYKKKEKQNELDILFLNVQLLKRIKDIPAKTQYRYCFVDSITGLFTFSFVNPMEVDKEYIFDLLDMNSLQFNYLHARWQIFISGDEDEIENANNQKVKFSSSPIIQKKREKYLLIDDISFILKFDESEVQMMIDLLKEKYKEYQEAKDKVWMEVPLREITRSRLY